MRVIRANVTRVCAICERTLLMGEHATPFSPDGHEHLDVCPLCHDVALASGWVREGNVVSPALQAMPARRKRQKTLWQTLLGARDEAPEPVVAEPILRRLTDDELALVEAADLFKQSTFPRTIAGVNAESILTFAWEITWYQYRVSPESAQAVRIEDRGEDIAELPASFSEWNARFDADGRVVPALAVS